MIGGDVPGILGRKPWDREEMQFQKGAELPAPRPLMAREVAGRAALEE